MSADRFPALEAARRHDAAARIALHIGGHEVGSVSRGCLDAVAAHAPWLILRDGALHASLPPGAALDAAFARSNAALRAIGLVTGWRDERFAVLPAFGAPPLASIERAAARFWGTLTLGAHANGYRADATGRPTHLWIAQRAFDKSTDPGRLDNLIGGGVAYGQSPFETLLREGGEEAGLDADTLRRATPGRVIELKRALPDCAGHGLQWEQLFGYDLQLDAGVQPVNRDGEVAALRCLPVDEALALAAGTSMTVDAALVTLDFALRHALLPGAEHAALEARLAGLLASGIALSPLR